MHSVTIVSLGPMKKASRTILSWVYPLSLSAGKCKTKTAHSREDFHSPARNRREEPGGQVPGGVYGVAGVQPHPQADAQDQETREQGLCAFQGFVVLLIVDDQNAQEQHRCRHKLQEQERENRSGD